MFPFPSTHLSPESSVQVLSWSGGQSPSSGFRHPGRSPWHRSLAGHHGIDLLHPLNHRPLHRLSKTSPSKLTPLRMRLVCLISWSDSQFFVRYFYFFFSLSLSVHNCFLLIFFRSLQQLFVMFLFFRSFFVSLSILVKLYLPLCHFCLFIFYLVFIFFLDPFLSFYLLIIWIPHSSFPSFFHDLFLIRFFPTFLLCFSCSHDPPNVTSRHYWLPPI